MSLDLAHIHAAVIERQNPLVESVPAVLVLGDDLGLETAVAGAQVFNWEFTKFIFERFMAFAIAGVACWVGQAKMQHDFYRCKLNSVATKHAKSSVKVHQAKPLRLRLNHQTPPLIISVKTTIANMPNNQITPITIGSAAPTNCRIPANMP